MSTAVYVLATPPMQRRMVRGLGNVGANRQLRHGGYGVTSTRHTLTSAIYTVIALAMYPPP
ncbi:MAG: hypothetical protein QXM12_02740 [Nitrososphaerota archaeon]